MRSVGTLRRQRPPISLDKTLGRSTLRPYRRWSVNTSNPFGRPGAILRSPKCFTMSLGYGFVSTAQCPTGSMKNALGTSRVGPPENRCPPSREQMPALPRTDACPREGKKYISREQVYAPCQTWDCRSVPRPSSYVIHGLCRLHLLTKLCLFYSCIVTWYCTHSSLVGKTYLLGRRKG